MKKIFLLLSICLLAAGSWSCTEDSDKDNAKIAELEAQIAQLKAQLASNAKIAKVDFQGDQMMLTFSDGTTLTTAVPENVIPTVGENGNWWINGEDLGVPAVAQIPTVGENGNWWVGGKDTGVRVQGDKGDQGQQGDKGDKGDKGDAGTGIRSTSYDPETGILTLTLTDGTSYQYALSGNGDGSLIGNRLEDLNGAYLLAGIRNGDLPFAQFTYDAANRMTSVTYYETLLNAPVKSLDVQFTYTPDGKIATRTATQYAKQNQVSEVNDYVYNNRYGDYGDFRREIPQWMHDAAQTKTLTQMFNILFPNDDIPELATESGSGKFANQTYTAGDRKELFMEKLFAATDSYGLRWLVRGTTVYAAFYGYDGQWKLLALPREQAKAYRVEKSGAKYYAYSMWAASDYDKDETNYGDDMASHDGFMHGVEAFDLAQTTVMSFLDDGTRSLFTDFDIQLQPQYFNLAIPIYRYRYEAKPYTSGTVDEIKGNRVDDYALTDAAETYDATGGNGRYKFLVRQLTSHAKGEVVSSVKVKYVYAGNDYQMDGTNDTGEVFNLCYITMKNGRMDKLQVFENGVKTDLLRFNYNTDGTLSTIDVLYENATEVARMAYDQHKNLTEMRVNSSKLAGKDRSYDDIFCDLGLAYRYTEYDKTQGCLVTRIKYTDGYATLLKLSYNYSLKNFMNHTFTALSPLMQAQNSTHALSEIAWAGHGSCLMTSFDDFNEGGYPMSMKGILCLSDFTAGDDQDIEAGYGGESSYESNDGFGLPVNGSVATLYKFTYTKKQ